MRALSPYIPVALYAFSLQALFLLLPLSVVEAGHSASLAAIIIGARGIGLLLMDIPAGYINDRFGNFIGMLAGTAIFIVGYALVSLSLAPSLMIAGGIIIGVGLSLAQIGRQGFIAFHLHSFSVGRKLSYLGSAVRIGSLLGPLLAAVLADNFGYPLSFRTLLILTCLSFAVELSIMLRSAIPRQPPDRSQTTSYRDLIKFLSSQKRLFFTTSGFIFFLQCLRSAKLVLIPLIGISLDFSVSAIGVAVALGTLLDSLVSIKAGRIMDSFGRRWSALPSLLGLSLGLFCLGLAESYMTFFAAVLFLGLSDGISAGLVLVLAADLSSEHKGRSQYLAVIKLISDSGLGLYPLVLGYFLLLAPVDTVTSLNLLVGLACSIYMYFNLQETKALSD